jgi:integrase
MSVYRRGKVYQYDFYFKGVRHQGSTRLRNQREAERWEGALKTKLANGEVGLREALPIPTFADAMKAFLEWSKGHHASKPRTSKRYLTSSAALLRYFRALRLDRISARDVENFKVRRLQERGERTNRPLRPATVNRELACGKAVFNFARKANRAVINPFSDVKFLAEDNEHFVVLTYEEEHRYLSAASQVLRHIAIVMLETGMRPEEVYRMDRENVHLDRRKYFNPFGKRPASRRWLELTDRAIAVLRERLAMVPGKYLFPHKKDVNRPMLKVNNSHDGAVRRSGVRKFRLYDLRHTYATREVESGTDLPTLAAKLGHSRLQMVLRYAHPTRQHHEESARRFEEFTTRQRMAAFEKADEESLQKSLH